MATYRVHKNANYTVMSNHHLRDKELSLKAKGLLSVMLMLPDDWRFSVSGLASLVKEGATSVRTTINELKEAGYVRVAKVRDEETGKFCYSYDVFEVPEGARETGEEKPVVVSPQLAIPGIDDVCEDDGHVESLAEVAPISKSEPTSEAAPEDAGKPPKKERDESVERDVTEAIEHLNAQAGTSFRPKSESHRRLVRARLAEGYTLDDVKAVVEKKCDEWMGTDHAMYLRPSTLFAKGHFDEYLNQPDRRKRARGGSHDEGWDQAW